MFLRKIAGVTAAGAMVLGGMAGLASPAQAADEKIEFNCTGPFGAMAYETAGNTAVTRNGQAVKVDWAVDDLPGIVPVPATADIEVTSNLLVNDVAVEATGKHTTSFGANEPIALPNVVGSLKTDATAINVKVVDLEIAVTNYDMVFPCTLEAPVELGDFTVEGAPAVAAKTKAVTTVKYAKKAKKATITTTVKAGKKNATGKVRITVKRGKKTVANKLVKLNKGKAKLVLKKGKLKAKGKYVVSAKFQGNKKFKASTAKKRNFKVKK